ncbi:MAG: nitroreductase family protein [Candidatus Bathyarchaeota archaeon]|nr:nitroreductase family protein [Candidatus Bathyarchaeota archaeon]
MDLGFETMIYEKITSRRTIRKYTRKDISKSVFIRCVDAARLSPSSMNLQPLKYLIVNDQTLLEKVFSTLKWAGYLPDYQPSRDEMPRGYIIILLDKEIRKSYGVDPGIAAMSISMVACEEGLGSCILGAIDKPELRRILNIPESLEIVLVVALGYPAEKPIVDKLKDGDIKYWLDDAEVLHVPKRNLEDILKWNGYV